MNIKTYFSLKDTILLKTHKIVQKVPNYYTCFCTHHYCLHTTPNHSDPFVLFQYLLTVQYKQPFSCDSKISLISFSLKVQ